MKRKLMIIATVAVVALLSFALVACTNNDSDKVNGNGSGADLSTKDIFAFSASSSAIMLDEAAAEQSGEAVVSVSGTREEQTVLPSQSAQSSAAAQSPAYGSELTEEEKQMLMEQLAVLENFIGDNAVTVTEALVGEDSAYFGIYEYSMIIATNDLSGVRHTFEMYYNQTYLGTEVDYDDDKPFFGQNGGDFEQEESFRLDGVVLYQGIEYQLTGIKEIETEVEHGQTETETKIEIIVKKSAGEYVRFEQEMSTEADETEQEFSYEYYQNGRKVKEFSLEIGVENGKKEMEMTSIENGKTFKVEYEEKRAANGKDFIEAEVVQNGVKTEVIITVEGAGTEEDPYRYVYRHGDDDWFEYRNRR